MANPAHTVRLRLTPGDLVSFDNRRILHARDAYEEGSAGKRHLQGTYVDADEMMSRLEALHDEQLTRNDM
jgi:gamma-butyrobetaine dioxygenase